MQRGKEAAGASEERKKKRTRMLELGMEAFQELYEITKTEEKAAEFYEVCSEASG
jgi:hypothetical protein